MKKYITIGLGLLLIACLAGTAFAGTAGVTNTVKDHMQTRVGGGDGSLQYETRTSIDLVVTKLDAMTTTDGAEPENLNSGAVPADVYQPVATMILEGTVTRVCTSADYGSWIMITNNAAVTITLPANAATAGSWIGFMSGDGVSDSCAPTISAATADTLVGLNDAAADSITYGTGHRIGFRVLFVSDGVKWHVYNQCINTMTLTS